MDLAQATPSRLSHEQILAWLRETDDSRLSQLWHDADRVRQRYVGGEVFLRGLIELSNYCVRLCAYCGLRAPNQSITRYRMTAEEVLSCARQAVALGYGTVVLQSGEDPGIEAPWMAELIRRIKAQSPLAVTLSLGEREDDELRLWRQAGADRYLLRFETSNAALYARIHPPKPGRTSDRLALLQRLREMGYEIGSGVMIGIPGQTYQDLADDLEQFAHLHLDMIGVGPYLVHPDTPLAHAGDLSSPTPDQVPADERTTYKVIALARLLCPRANIPSTTALATLNLRRGRELGLVRGANIVMPNLTPPHYRVHYEIYPNKACIRETADDCQLCMEARIRSLGRAVGTGPGTSPNYLRRAETGVPGELPAELPILDSSQSKEG